MTRYLLGYDPAQVADYTGIVVIDQAVRQDETGRPERHYQLRHLERFRERDYIDVGAHLFGLVTRLKATATDDEVSVDVVLDRTGVGVAVYDVLVAAGVGTIAQIVPVMIHGGSIAAFESGIHRVPKKDLVAAVAVALQGKRFKIAPGMRLAPVLTEELSRFKAKFNQATGHESFAAWREDDHDDLVLATACALWWGEQMLVGPLAIVANDDDW